MPDTGTHGSPPRRDVMLVRSGRLLLLPVIGVAAANWVGWATGLRPLIRIFPSWPAMTPWTAALLAALAAAILVQSGRPSARLVWSGRALAVAVGGLSLVFLAEYVTGRAAGLDQAWFPASVRDLQQSYPGRPSPQTAGSALFLSVAVGLQRLNRPWAPPVWAASLVVTLAIPFVVVLAYLTETLSLVRITASTGMGISTALALILLVGAAFATRPDRNPVAWVLARPDGAVLVRTAIVLAGLPILIGAARLALLALGLGDDTAWVLAVSASTVAVGAATFSLGQRAQEKLAFSEQRYRLLTENAGDVICHIRNGRFAWISPSVRDVLGAPPPHWLGRRVREIIPPEQVAGHVESWEKLNRGGHIKQRTQVISIDGSTHWVHLYARPFYGADGNQDGVTAAFRLIDDEVAAEQEAEEARRQQALADLRYRRSVDNAAVGMCLITPDGRFYEVNDALCQFFGYDAETLKEKTWQELTTPQYLEADQQNVNDVLEGRLDSYRMTKQYIHADGHRIWGDLSVSCIRDDNGSVINFISQIADITAAKEAEERNRILTRRIQQQSNQMKAELRSAANYMSSIMPRGLTGQVGVSSRYLPSSELGGDCFDYTWIDDDHLLVYLIDVSGHGVEPALLSVSLHNMLRSGSIDAETLLNPAQLMIELNRLFQMDQQHDHFFTMWCGTYQASTRTLSYASGGAPPALAFNQSADGTVSVTELATASLPLGLFTETEFTNNSYAVPHGCRLLIYSDGASEIPVDGQRQISLAEFKSLTTRLAGSPDWSPDDLIGELNALTPRSGFDDDCSLIQLRFD